MIENPREYFVETILPFSGKMFGVAAAITGSREDASDAVQTAMLRIWETVRSGIRPENPSAYCMSAIRNICLSEIAHSSRAVSLDSQSEIPSEKNSAESFLALKEVIGHLRKLPDKERQAVEMSAFAGSSSDDIAEALSVSTANARQLLSRGRRKLRDWFK